MVIVALTLCSEWLFGYRQVGSFLVISWRGQVTFRWDGDNIRFVLDQHAYVDFYSASSQKQQSTSLDVALLGHIILSLC
jgi:hypothetical protein